MTDIAKELRHIMKAGIRPIPPALIFGASDEIERLRAEIEALRIDNGQLRVAFKEALGKEERVTMMIHIGEDRYINPEHVIEVWIDQHKEAAWDRPRYCLRIIMTNNERYFVVNRALAKQVMKKLCAEDKQ
jgi:hypothetical protein